MYMQWAQIHVGEPDPDPVGSRSRLRILKRAIWQFAVRAFSLTFKLESELKQIRRNPDFKSDDALLYATDRTIFLI
jgi:hypothetical protein